MSRLHIMKYCRDYKLGKWIQGIVQHYNHDKYWRRRNVVINPIDKTNIFIKLYYLWYIKRCDAFNNCSFGTDLNSGARFAEPPYLPHGPNGIIVGHDVAIGCYCTIYHHVTIMQGGVELEIMYCLVPGQKFYLA